MFYNREEKLIGEMDRKMFLGDAIILYGPRRVGKTELVNKFLDKYSKEHRVGKFNFDDPDDRTKFYDRGKQFLTYVIDQYDIVFIDEVQKLSNFGESIKILVDKYGKEKQFILTGSSVITMKNLLNESMTGRKFIFNLLPLSYKEIIKNKSIEFFKNNLRTQLIYGSYPQVQTEGSFIDKEDRLDEITDSYLYKDILDLTGIRDEISLRKIVKLIATQLGSEFSTTRIANDIGISKQTVDNYIDLLEKNFVIFQLESYSRNKKREIVRNKKIYFYDTGIRNAVINDFRLPEDRNDMGQLWENFIIVEKLKRNIYDRKRYQLKFWRTFDGAEVDLVEYKPGSLNGFEIKYNEKVAKVPKKFAEYEGVTFDTVNLENFHSFLI